MKKFFGISLLLVSSLIFVGCSNSENASNDDTQEITSASTSNTETESHSDNDLPETGDTDEAPPVTGNADVDSRVTELTARYDELIDRVQGFSNNPDTFTPEERTKYIQDLDAMKTSFTDISEQLNLKMGEEADPTPYVNVLNYLQDKNEELLKSAS